MKRKSADLRGGRSTLSLSVAVSERKKCEKLRKFMPDGHGCLVVFGVVLVIGILGSVFSGGASTPEAAQYAVSHL